MDVSSVSVVSLVGTTFVSSANTSTSLTGSFSPDCIEGDSRLLLYAHDDAVRHGAKTVVIHTVDTDVLVLAVSYYFLLKQLGQQKIWLDSGVGKSWQYIAVHQIAEALGEDKSVALRGFHSFSGCDTTSSFASNEKVKAWRAWQKFDSATEAFLAISHPLDVVDASTNRSLEKFVVLLYDAECLELPLISQARKVLFTSKSRSLENLPPTSAALQQHILRAAHQAGHVWGQALNANPHIPRPKEWGWTMQGDIWVPRWSILPPVAEACRELVKCGCRKGCGIRCSCRNAGLPCSLLCKHCRATCTTAQG